MSDRNEDGRRQGVGAILSEQRCAFRVWAPDHRKVDIEFVGGHWKELLAERNGYFSADLPAKAGDKYFIRLDDGDERFADPASRYQPKGLNGPSEIVSSKFLWQDAAWTGLTALGQIIYELRVGTFTPEGTWSAALSKLDWLADLGITVIELLPVAEFRGDFGWGYDGVLLYAPNHTYGEPDDFRRFIDAAHARDIGVILDVVYNHFGVGDRFEAFTAKYFSERDNEWGRSLNFADDGQSARSYIVENALYWIEEFHLDGLRLDAAHALEDDSGEHVIAEIVRRCREAARPRNVLIIAESEPQDTKLARAQDKGGYGLDAIWNEDFHHSAVVAATARREAYMHDHAGSAAELVAAAKYGLLYQGQRYDWQNKPRGSNGFDLRPFNFITYLQNHDQVANSATGRRFWRLTSPSRARAITALLLLAPQTPMLFQGQEFAASTPFLYFLDNSGEDADKVAEGRAEFLQQFQSLQDRDAVQKLNDPANPETFNKSKLDWLDTEPNAHVARLHHDLIAIRRSDEAIASQPSIRDGMFDAAVLGNDALMLRYFSERADDTRLLLINLGRDLPLRSIADPLAAPPAGREWQPIWSSEDTVYGGAGRREMDLARRFTLPGEVAILFGTKPAEDRHPLDKDKLDQCQRTIF